MTSQTSTIRTDLLDRDETENPQRVLVEHVYDVYVAPLRANGQPPLKSIGPAKSLDECLVLIHQAITAKETVSEITEDAKLKYFGWEEPVKDAQLEAITILPVRRLAGQLAAGRPDRGNSVVREIKPHLREEIRDPDHKGYNLAILGQIYDNYVEFTCWGRTNKTAYRRALWFEDLIQEYAWYFTMNGVSRIINQGHKQRVTKKIGDNAIYGYPVECFIRTEKITHVSEKILEQIIIQIGLADS
jgi:hypothetical protein